MVLFIVLSEIHIILLNLPTQKRFPIGGERIMCHGLKLTNSLGQIKLTKTPYGNNLNFGLACHQVVDLETVGNLCTVDLMLI